MTNGVYVCVRVRARLCVSLPRLFRELRQHFKPFSQGGISIFYAFLNTNSRCLSSWVQRRWLSPTQSAIDPAGLSHLLSFLRGVPRRLTLKRDTFSFLERFFFFE